MTMYIPFADIDQLKPGQQLSFETPYGSLIGTVAEVVPGKYVSIDNGTGPWHITFDHMSNGLLTTTETEPL